MYIHAMSLCDPVLVVTTLAGHLDLRVPLTQDLGSRPNQPAEATETTVSDEEPVSADEPATNDMIQE